MTLEEQLVELRTEYTKLEGRYHNACAKVAAGKIEYDAAMKLTEILVKDNLNLREMLMVAEAQREDFRKLYEGARSRLKELEETLPKHDE